MPFKNQREGKEKDDENKKLWCSQLVFSGFPPWERSGLPPA